MAAKQEGVGRAWIRALKTEPLERLYIFYGEETYRRETAIGMIRRRLSPEGGFDWDSVELRGRGVTPDAISEAVSTPPLSAERTAPAGTRRSTGPAGSEGRRNEATRPCTESSGTAWSAEAAWKRTANTHQNRRTRGRCPQRWECRRSA